jgi:hypothetical protein
MTDLFEAIRILFLIVFAVFANIVYLLIYNILTEKGIKVTWFRGHISTLLDFSDLANKTENLGDKRYYKNLLRTFIVILILFIGTASTFILDIKYFPCKTYSDFLTIELSGRVINKYEDKPNHNYPTLTIETNEGETTNEIFLSLRNNGLFDSVRIGDFVKKTKGDSMTYLLRSDNRRIEFKINKEDYCRD